MCIELKIECEECEKNFIDDDGFGDDIHSIVKTLIGVQETFNDKGRILCEDCETEGQESCGEEQSRQYRYSQGVS